MRPILLLTVLALFIGTLCAKAQGTFIYDQQSSTVSNAPATIMLEYVPGYGAGQSFTPTLSSVSFIRLWLIPAGPSQGGLISCALRSGSINGPIIGETPPVYVAGTFSGPLSLQFSNPVAVTPGTTCYFEPLAERSCDAGIGFSVIPEARRS
ncbi:MAG TPA: hypothetical protein VG167_22830 [Verrucomicrobiae bacterium]|nr:hypothetical protein [Verrucomicrobiae bacterium]